MASDLEKVDPLPGLAPWLGGKKLLAERLSARFAEIPHTCYAEPCVGLGSAFFGRRRRPKVEVVNDLNGQVVNVFRVARHHPHALIRELQGLPFARAEFSRLLDADAAQLTDVQRAARFLFLQRVRFGGCLRSRSFAATLSASKALSHRAMRQRLLRLSARLAKVTIECLPYADFIARYDRAGTLFYLDPPYWGHERAYGQGLFDREDFAVLAKLLGRLKGRFVLSINDVPEIRSLFGSFRIEEVQTAYSRPRNGRKQVTELIISG